MFQVKWMDDEGIMPMTTRTTTTTVAMSVGRQRVARPIAGGLEHNSKPHRQFDNLVVVTLCCYYALVINKNCLAAAAAAGGT